MGFIDNIIINCKRATYLQEKKSEGKIGISESLGLGVHLLYCKFCRLFLKQMAELTKYSKHFSDTSEKRFNLNPARKADLQKAFKEELEK